MKRVFKWYGSPLLGAAFWAGCATQSPSIKEEWIARLPSSQMTDIYSARAEERQATDAVTRAQVLQQDAQRALEVSRIERDAARAGVRASEKRVEAARAVGREAGISLAQRDLGIAQERLAAAEAEVTWRERALESREAAVSLAERKAELEAARLDWVKYQTLREAGDTRVRDIREEPYRKELARAEGEVHSARRALEVKQQVAERAKAIFERREETLPAYGGSGLAQ